MHNKTPATKNKYIRMNCFQEALMKKFHVDFESMLDARKALSALKEKGYQKVHLDMLENYMEEYSAEINVPGTVSAPSLSALVLKSRSFNQDASKAPLIAANPMVSGVGSYCELAGNPAVRLVVTVEDEKLDEVNGIIRSFESVHHQC